MLTASNAANAGEGFQIRYNIAGSLGGESFTPPNTSGLALGLAMTRMSIDKVTGDDGNLLTKTVPGGTVPLPAPTPSALYPTYESKNVQIDGKGTLDLLNFVAGYVTTDSYSGGRLIFAVNVPYGRKTQTFGVNGTTPPLSFNPAIPPATQAAVSAGFDAKYQGGLAAQAASETGEISGIGDTDLLMGWVFSDDKLRVLAGASLVLPTGKYDSAPGPDIGFGNFYTLRPAVQAAYLPRPDISVSGKFTLGFNTTNKDNNLKSGNWAALEGAAAYMTPIGPVGVHMIYANQYQDDTGNPWGSSRFQTTNGGVFFTTKIPGIDTVMTAQYMSTIDSRNAKSGTFAQLRFLKAF
jgi:hypothetical protein